ncbi:MAG: metal-dependent hydrolase [Promethearchaeia archaeon]
MNEITHFFFGYFIARVIMKKEHDKFETFFLSMCALIPDFDEVLGIFINFEHGVFSHTIIGGLLFTFIYVSIIWLIGSKFFKSAELKYRYLLYLGIIGMFSHLFLDSFTYYNSYQSDGTHHMYFWPIWNFPFHINTIFPGATFQLRILIEILFSAFLAIIIIFYLGIIKKENPFCIFLTKNWLKHLSEELNKEKLKIISKNLLSFNIILLILIFISYII